MQIKLFQRVVFIANSLGDLNKEEFEDTKGVIRVRKSKKILIYRYYYIIWFIKFTFWIISYLVYQPTHCLKLLVLKHWFLPTKDRLRNIQQCCSIYFENNCITIAKHFEAFLGISAIKLYLNRKRCDVLCNFPK